MRGFIIKGALLLEIVSVFMFLWTKTALCRPVMSCHVLCCQVLSCLVWSCVVLSCVVSFGVLSCLVWSCIPLSCLIWCIVFLFLMVRRLVLSWLVVGWFVLMCIVYPCLVVMFSLVYSCLVSSIKALNLTYDTHWKHRLLSTHHYIFLDSLVVGTSAMSQENADHAFGGPSPPNERYKICFYCRSLTTMNIPSCV